MTGRERKPLADSFDERLRRAAPHGSDEPCTCDGCWACAGRVLGCTCDIAWDELAELRRESWIAEPHVSPVNSGS